MDSVDTIYLSVASVFGMGAVLLADVDPGWAALCTAVALLGFVRVMLRRL